jgi:hypothetical protein
MLLESIISHKVGIAICSLISIPTTFYVINNKFNETNNVKEALILYRPTLSDGESIISDEEAYDFLKT